MCLSHDTTAILIDYVADSRWSRIGSVFRICSACIARHMLSAMLNLQESTKPANAYAL
jgi:hypothetical protein